MTRPEQWILFVLGIALIVVGAGLLTWVNVQRRAHAGGEKGNWVAQIVNAFANLFAELGKLLGPDPAAKAGGFLIVVGCALTVGAVFV